ncbi:MAG: hypothetical protein A2X49_04365 [Lentisphaerae bacterium GWF2_52_8]|nr:MAG: hypothetical protein A2X49_04365 [Lentisphaerae bacterium GWF2_52_8]
MSKFNKIITWLSALAVSALLLAGAGFAQKRLDALRIEHKLTDTGPVENVPPVVAFTTVVLGSFRGLLADIIWLRTTTLQDEGKYFEMVQLASWITKLQPRFSGAVAYLAWNMAYNISVTYSSPEDRWRWVQRGIELIRDEALLYNPTEPILYKELGWIYQHKIGNILDDANLYYKNQLAIAMMKVFNGPDANWKEYAAAPKSQKEFLSKYPPQDSFWKALSAAGFKSFEDLNLELRKTGLMPQSFVKALNDRAKEKTIETALRAVWLREEYKLDPREILEINRTYGALDWRLPEAHAIYWATLGEKRYPHGTSIDCERMITQSLHDAFMGGRLLMVDKDKFARILTVPNLHVVDAVTRTYREAYEREKVSTFRNAMVNFMKDAVTILYSFGNYSKAQEYLDKIAAEEPGNREYKKSLDEYVLKQWAEDVSFANMKQASDFISGLLFQSCYFLAWGDRDAANAHERMARFVYAKYHSDQKGSSQRTGLAPYKEIKKQVTESCLKNFPEPVSKLLRDQLTQESIKKEEQEKQDKQ